jgi:hypothetical protein
MVRQEEEAEAEAEEAKEEQEEAKEEQEEEEEEEHSNERSSDGSDGGGGWETDSDDEAMKHAAHVALAAGPSFRRRPRRAERRRRRREEEGHGSPPPAFHGRSEGLRSKALVQGGENRARANAAEPADPWREPEPQYSRRNGFINFVKERVGLAQRRHAHRAARADRSFAAVIIQRTWKLQKERRRRSRSCDDGAALPPPQDRDDRGALRLRLAPRSAATPSAGGGVGGGGVGGVGGGGGLGAGWGGRLAQLESLRPLRRWWVRAQVALLRLSPLEANVGHMHRAMLRYVTFLVTLLLTALLIRPTRLHAWVNAIQCSAAATAAHTVLAKLLQRMEQMQNPFYLRRAKRIRSLKKRQSESLPRVHWESRLRKWCLRKCVHGASIGVMDCYAWVSWLVEGCVQILCALGTYLVLLYWLKFDQQTAAMAPSLTLLHGDHGSAPMSMQFYWLYSAVLAAIANGLVWGQLRRRGPCFRRRPPPRRPPRRRGVRAAPLSSAGSSRAPEQPSPAGGARCGDLCFVLMLLAVAGGLLYGVYRHLPPPPEEAAAALARQRRSATAAAAGDPPWLRWAQAHGGRPLGRPGPGPGPAAAQLLHTVHHRPGRRSSSAAAGAA